MSSNTVTTTSSPVLSNAVYDKLKFVAQVVLPALGALYFGLSEIWALPYGVEVVGTITVVDVFLGAVLQLSTKQYNHSEDKFDGALVVDSKSDPNKVIYSFEPSGDIDALQHRDVLTFRVVNDSE